MFASMGIRHAPLGDSRLNYRDLKLMRRGVDGRAKIAKATVVKFHAVADIGRCLVTGLKYAAARLLRALVPCVLTDRRPRKVLPVDLPARPWPVNIAKLKNRTLRPVVERFIDHLRDSPNPCV